MTNKYNLESIFWQNESVTIRYFLLTVTFTIRPSLYLTLHCDLKAGSTVEPYGYQSQDTPWTLQHTVKKKKNINL